MNIEIKPTIPKPVAENKKTVIWQSKSGNTTFIEDMVNTHLDNCLAMVKRQEVNTDVLFNVYECLRLEKQRRELAPGEIQTAIENRKINIFKRLKGENKTFTFNIHSYWK